MTYTADDALAMLEALPADEPVEGWDEKLPPWFTHVTYTFRNGWKMNVFFDGYDWDYVDHFTAPNGQHINPDNSPKPEGEEFIWHPAFDWCPKAGDARWGWKDHGC